MNRSRKTADLASHGNIFVDIANDRVGIGTTQPTHKIDVSGNIKLHDQTGYDNHITYKSSGPAPHIHLPTGPLANLARTPYIGFGDRGDSSGDFKIYHDHYNAHLKLNANFGGGSGGGLGGLFLSNHSNSGVIGIQGANGSGSAHTSIYIPAGATAGVKIYQAGQLRFETVGYGVTVHGTTETQELNVTGVSTFHRIESTATSFAIHNSADRILMKANNRIDLADNRVRFQSRDQSTILLDAVAGSSGFVNLYQNNSIKLTTESYGVNVNGNFVADCSVTIDPDSYTNHFITGNIADGSGWGAYGIAFGQGTGKMTAFGVASHLYMAFGDGSNANSLSTFQRVTTSGVVELYHNGSKKFETTSTGVSVTGNITATGTLDTGNATLNRADITVVTDGSRNNGAFIEAGDTGQGNRPKVRLKGAGNQGLSQDAIQVFYDNGSTKSFELDYEGNIEARDLDVRHADFSAGIDVTGSSTFSSNVSVSGQLTVGQLASPTKIQAGNPTLRFIQQNNSLSNRGYIEFYYNTSNLSARISGKARNSANGQIYFDVEKDSTLTNILLVDDAGVDITGNITGTGNLTLTSTDAGSSAAPEFKLFRNSASPADADYLGQIKFAGESDTGVERNYAKITGKILDASNGTEDGILEFAHIKAGSQTITGRWRSDSLQLLNDTNLSVDGIGVFGRNSLDPDSYGASSGGFGGISDGSGWSAMGVFVHGGGTGDAAAMAHNGGALYFGIQDGANANSMETWLQVTPGSRVINFTTDNNSTNFQCGGNVIWHAGNDGAGSTLDADLLDGVQGSGYVRTILTDHDITGRLDSGFYETNSATTAEGWPETTNSDFHLIAATHSNTANYYSMQFAGSMHHQDKFYIRSTGNSGTRSWSKIWTSSSDGSGSGLDADTLDGVQGSSFLRSDADDTMSEKLTFTQHGQTEFLRTPGNVTMHSVGSGDNQLILRNLGQLRFQDGSDWNYNEWAGIKFVTSSDIMFIGGPASSEFTNNGGAANINVNFVGVNNNGLQKDGNTVWHAGNDGSGSGLDADLLDGLQSTKFLRLDADNSVTSYQNKTTWPSSTSIGTGSGHQASLEVYQGTAQADAFMAFHVAGDFAAYFGLDGGTNDFAVGGWSMGAVSNKVWHAGNDGSGSGLDADTVDGVHASSFCRTDTTFTFNASGNDINLDYDSTRNIVRIQRNGSERFMLGAAGNEIKINTSNGGFLTFGTSLLPQNDNSVDLGSSSKRWANLYTADAHFNNIGTGGNDIDGTEGSWTLQEAEDNIYMINRKNGKRYKIKMEEV